MDPGRLVGHLERELRQSLLIVRVGGLPLEGEVETRRDVDLAKRPGQLEGVAVGERGDLAAPLSAVCR